MTTLHLVDPELLPLLDVLPPFNLKPHTLAAVRRAGRIAAIKAAQDAPSYEHEVRDFDVPGPEDAPTVHVRVYRPHDGAAALPVLVWLHGGGFVMGSVDEDDLRAHQIVAQTGCAVVSVDYRLAPETPFPGGIEDCYAALRWTFDHATEQGFDPDRIMVGGMSAGAGLAAALALLARDRAEVPLAFQLLIYPMLDDRTVTHPDPHPFTGEFVWTPVQNRFGWHALLGVEPGGADVSPYAAPARAMDLANLPPTFISVGTLDLFLEEDMEYARRLIRAGVPTELHVYPGAFHGFPRVPTAQVTQAHVRDWARAVRRMTTDD